MSSQIPATLHHVAAGRESFCFAPHPTRHPLPPPPPQLPPPAAAAARRHAETATSDNRVNRHPHEYVFELKICSVFELRESKKTFLVFFKLFLKSANREILMLQSGRDAYMCVVPLVYISVICIPAHTTCSCTIAFCVCS
jgi:hypothetical protein